MMCLPVLMVPQPLPATKIGLEGKDQQIAHETDMFRETAGDASRFGGVRRLDLRQLGGALDSLLDVAHGREILVELPLIGGAQFAAQVAGIFPDEIEHTL